MKIRFGSTVLENVPDGKSPEEIRAALSDLYPELANSRYEYQNGDLVFIPLGSEKGL